MWKVNPSTWVFHQDKRRALSALQFFSSSFPVFMFVINAVRNSGPKPEPVLKQLSESCLYLLMYAAQTGALTGKDEDTNSLRLCHTGLFLNKLSETNVGRNFWERKKI